MTRNTVNEKAEKGSKHWMQEIVNDDHIKSIFKQQLSETINMDVSCMNWLSPLQQTNYEEYMLNNTEITEILKKAIPNYIAPDAKFWPSRQPQWDGIAILKDENNIPHLLLVEAKSHRGETYNSKDTIETKMSKGSIENLNLIKKTLIQTQEHFGIENISLDNWLKGKYQMSNRFAFLMFFQRAKIPVKLLFVNIIEDPTMKGYGILSDLKWNQRMEEICLDMTGSSNYLDGMHVLNLEIKNDW